MKLLTSSFLALSLALTAPTFAQDTTTAEPATPTVTTEAPAPAPTTPADEAFPVEPQAPEKKGPYVRETHGTWEVRCTKAGEEEVCNLYQLLKDKNDVSVAEMNIEVLPAGGQAAAGITLITPLGTLLTAQVGWRIDSGKVRRYPFSWCEKSGCVARFGLTPADIASMKKGAKGNISVVSIADPKKPFDLSMPLTGFTAAWNSIPAPTK
jgi:invasion protein IalB